MIKKLTSTLLIIILVLIAVAAGFAVWKTYKWNEEKANLAIQPKKRNVAVNKNTDSSLTGNRNQIANLNLNTNQTIDISDWRTYRNKEYGFEVRYPGEWFVIEETNQYTKEKFFRFWNYKTSFEKSGMPNNSLAFYIMIYPMGNTKVFRNFEKMEKDYINFSNRKVEYDIGNSQKVKLYIISKRTTRRDNISWDVILPRAKAFLTDDNYGYIFYHSSPVPSGIEGQKKAIDILEKFIQFIQSFGFN